MTEPFTDPIDQEHEAELSPIIAPGQPLGNVNRVQKMMAGLVGIFQKVLGADPIRTMKFLRMGVQYLSVKPQLLECDQMSFLLAMMQCAELGLMPGPTTGHAYFIPFKDKHRGNKQYIQLIPGYKGYIHCAYRSGQIDAIEASAVYEGDEFSYQRGTKSFIEHKPGAQEGRLTHAYTIVWLKGSSRPISWVIDEAQANRAKASSQAARNNSGPWIDHPAPMWVKTSFKRIVPWIPVSFELSRILDIDSRDERDGSMQKATLSGAGVLPTDTPPEAEAPKALPDRSQEPIDVSAKATRAKAPMTRGTSPRAATASQAPPDGAGEFVPSQDNDPPPEEEQPAPRAAAAPRRPVLQNGKDSTQKLQSDIMDLVAALSAKKVPVNLPKDFDGLPVKELTALRDRLRGKYEAVKD